MNELDLQEVTIRFGGLTAVDRVSFSVPKGQIVSVIGPNGAGKTTVFNIVTGVYEPTSGSVLVAGQPAEEPFRLRVLLGALLIGAAVSSVLLALIHCESLWAAGITEHYVYQQPFPWRKGFAGAVAYIGSLAAADILVPALLGLLIGTGGALTFWQRARRSPEVMVRRGLSRTFQNIRIFSKMSVLENVLVGMNTKIGSNFLKDLLVPPALRTWERRAITRAREILAFMGLDEECDHPAAKLSYGHQRRLEIARALASRPRVLLLDEPAAGMNPSEAQELMQLIRRIRDSGVTVVLIEHHMKVVMGISDRIVVLDYGEKIAEGTPAEVQCDARVIEAYLGGEAV